MPRRDLRLTRATELMMRFAERTGLTGRSAPHRQLWTDAFAVCNFLGLARVSGDRHFLDLTKTLVDQVHHVLGRHRADDPRTGWISGLDDAAGELHPTIGGLRIGKPLPERAPDERYLAHLECNRDGQSFHHLTKWMLALERYALDTRRVQPMMWARELAHVAHRAFTIGPMKARRLVSKMSIDLSRPLVDSMGPHDALAGLVACLELDVAADALGTPGRPALDAAIAEYTNLVDRDSFATADPLALGGLLVTTWRFAKLPTVPEQLVLALLDTSATGIEHYAQRRELLEPAARGLAFHELGLAIGLAAYARIPPDAPPPEARSACDRIDRHLELQHQIEAFWLHDEHRAAPAWTDYADLNDAMLATCLCPDGLLAA